MIVNDNKINVFSPLFTYSLICGNNEKNGEHGALYAVINHFHEPSGSFKTGDYVCTDSEFFRYPKNIAVLFECEDTFVLQTFKDGRVARLFDDVLACENQVRTFFEECKGELIILENFWGRRLSKDFDRFFAYIKGLSELRHEFNKNRDTVYEYADRLNAINERLEMFPDKYAGQAYEEFSNTAFSFLCAMQGALDRFNTAKSTQLDNLYLSVLDREADCMLFGLYYKYLKFGARVQYYTERPKSYSASIFGSFLEEFAAFIKNTPSIIQNYCEYMHFSKYDYNMLINLLNEEGVLEKSQLSFVDALL